jgi:hypothetical protein
MLWKFQDIDARTHGMNDNVKTADLSQSEFRLLNTGGVNLLPDPDPVSENYKRRKVGTH